MTGNGAVLVKGRAGLGNRIVCALTGILYARLTRRRLIVDWRDPVFSDDELNVFPLLFECPPARPVTELPATDSVAPSIWRGHLSISSRALQRLHPELSHAKFRRVASMDPDETRLPRGAGRHVALAGQRWERWSGRIVNASPASSETCSRISSCGAIAAADLVLAAAVRERVERFRAEHFRDEMVGVHVRYSDKRVPVAAIRRRLERLLARQPSIGIFLATDNSEIRDMFERSYENVVTAPHWYPVPGRSAHHDPSCPDRLENARTGLVDLYLLAACDHLVADTSSTFAQVAWLLSNRGPESLDDVRRTATPVRRLRGIVRRMLPGGSEPCAPW